MEVTTDYLQDVFNPTLYERTLRKASKDIRTWGRDFQAIAFTGVSGAAIAFPLGRALRKSLICVRKEGARSHSEHDVEGDVNASTYIIVDDFVETGSTVKTIQARIAEAGGNGVCVGLYTYCSTLDDDAVAAHYFPNLHIPRT